MAARFVASSSKTLEGRAGLTERPRRLLCGHWASSRPASAAPSAVAGGWVLHQPLREGGGLAAEPQAETRCQRGALLPAEVCVRPSRTTRVPAARGLALSAREGESHGTAWVPGDWSSPISRCGSRDCTHLLGSGRAAVWLPAPRRPATCPHLAGTVGDILTKVA